MSTPTISRFKPSAPCSCKTCKGMCKRACWPTPQEAARLLDAGYANKLMLDAWIGGFDNDHKDCYLVCPATPGFGGRWAPGLGDDFDWFGAGLRGGCVMHGSDGLCELHDKGLKPFEGRVAHHSKDVPRLHEAVARTWYSNEGRAVVQRFCELAGVSLP